MTLFNNKRLSNDTFKINDEIISKIREGYFSDDYFKNTTSILEKLAKEDYKFGIKENDLEGTVDVKDINVGDLYVELQIFTSRKGKSLIVGVDEVLNILKVATGYYEGDTFINTFNKLEIDALYDGDIVEYKGNKEKVMPVLKIKGRYRDFGYLETIILGILSEPTRIATNVYNILLAAKGKPVLFFPARFSHYNLQNIHGYAYFVAVERYNYDFGESLEPFVSTKEQGEWWNGKASGTIAHSTIACFFGNTAETMIQYSKVIDSKRPRIALIDFHNDCVGDGIKVLDEMWKEYWNYLKMGNIEEALKYKLYGVRPDTSGNLIDKSLVNKYNIENNKGVNPDLVFEIKKAISKRWKHWLNTYKENEEEKFIEEAKKYCEDIKIIVTGGFNVDKIKKFEELNVPVDIYGVGSSLLENSSKTNTNNDFTADIVKVKLNDKWYNLSKIGRKSCTNENLVTIKKF